jgi:hypothetical protein
MHCLLILGTNNKDCFAKTQADTGDLVSSVLQKPDLKILHIGNSYTFDAVSYLPTIIKNNDVDVSDLCIYRTMRAGGTFKLWYDIYHDNDHAYNYQIEKVCGGIDANIATGDGAAGDGSLFRQALTDEQWDIIFIQPASAYAPYYERTVKPHQAASVQCRYRNATGTQLCQQLRGQYRAVVFGAMGTDCRIGGEML